MISWKNELTRIKPELAPGVRAFFTERVGGVSSGPWGGPEGIMGLNVGSRVEDNAGCVRMNRSIVADLCPAEPRWMTQVHGINVVTAEDVADETVEADAQITTKPDTVCVVQVADCLPVLIADKKGRIVAAVHAGWRSLADGIIQKTVGKLREELTGEGDFAVWLGPRIGKDEFEVGGDVLEAMKAHLPQAEKAFRAANEPGKYFADLALLACQALEASGIPAESIADCGLSTFGDPARFFSFRRDGEKSGRHAALIWIEPQNQK